MALSLVLKVVRSAQLAAVLLAPAASVLAQTPSPSVPNAGSPVGFSVLSPPSLLAAELVTNGTFESGSSGWSPSGDFHASTLFNNYHYSPGYAYLSNSDGSSGNNLNGTLSQTFTVPSVVSSATLTFWYSVTTQDSLTTPHDVVSVSLQPSNTFVHAFSNTAASTSGYQQYSFNLTPFAGQAVTLRFFGTTDAANPTTFRIDDVSATYVSANPPVAPSNLNAIGDGKNILMNWQDNSTNALTFEIARAPLGMSFVQWKTVGANTTAVQDTDQAYGSITCYRVRATNSAGTSGYSNEDCATALEPPLLLEPSDGATTTSLSVTMRWQSVLGANRYGLDVGNSCGGTEILDHRVTDQTSYTLNVSPGTYVWRVRAANVTYEGVSAPTDCRTFTVTNTPPPLSANFDWSPFSAKVDEFVRFNDLSTGNPSSWFWEFGDGGTSDLRSPEHAYRTSGTFTVTLRVTTGSGSDTAIHQISVTAPPTTPVTDFTFSPSNPTVTTAVQFTDASTGNPSTFAWDFDGNGTVDSSAQNPTHTFTTAGTYPVKLTASNAVGSSSKTKNVTIAPAAQNPVASFTFTPTTPKTSENVQFTDKSSNTPTSWSWRFGDGSTGTTQHPTHAYTSAGTFTVQLTVTNSAGNDSSTHVITVQSAISPPIAKFSWSPTYPAASTDVAFTDLSSGNPTSWSWTFADGATSTARNPTHRFAVGQYNVTLTVSNADGVDAIDHQITIGTKPTPTFSYRPENPSINQDVLFTASADVPVDSWSWVFDDGSASTLQNPTHRFASAGKFDVQLRAGNKFGTGSASTRLTILNPLVCTRNCVTISGRVLIEESDVTVRGTRGFSRAVTLTDAGGKATDWRMPIGEDGSYSFVVSQGTYGVATDIHYVENIYDSSGLHPPTTTTVPEFRRLEKTLPPRAITSSMTIDIELPRPIVFLHGFMSGPYRWSSWIGQFGSRTSDPRRASTAIFTPAYSDLVGFRDSAYAVRTQLLDDFADLFNATPPYHIVAHSKGGIITRVMWGDNAGEPLATQMKAAVLLGTPNDGTECFTDVGSGVFNLNRCQMQNSWNSDPRYTTLPVRVLVIAGSKSLPTCLETPPKDSVVPVDSVFKITRLLDGKPIAKTFTGYVVPYGHTELGSAETLWLLDRVVLPFFRNAALPAACPATYSTPAVSCSRARPTPSEYCLEGRGLTPGGCTVSLRDQAIVGARLSWSPPSGATFSPSPTSVVVVPFDRSSCATLGAADSGVSAAGLLGYHVYRSSSAMSSIDPSMRVAFVSATETSFVDPSPFPGHNHYAVSAVYETAESTPAPAPVIQITTRRRAARH